jgi:hypothetical protein
MITHPDWLHRQLDVRRLRAAGGASFLGSCSASCTAARGPSATLASVAAKTRADPRKRDLDLTDVDKAVTHLENNRQHMKYDKARKTAGRSRRG